VSYASSGKLTGMKNCTLIHPTFGPCIETGEHGDQHRPHRYAEPETAKTDEVAYLNDSDDDTDGIDSRFLAAQAR